MKITWFGHSAFRLEFGSSVVLIDPFLTGNPQAAVTAEEVDPTVILVTHDPVAVELADGFVRLDHGRLVAA